MAIFREWCQNNPNGDLDHGCPACLAAEERAKQESLASLTRAISTTSAPSEREQKLLAALMPLYEAAQSWHNFHHSVAIQCDDICKALPLAWSAITGAEPPKEASRPTLRIVAAPEKGEGE